MEVVSQLSRAKTPKTKPYVPRELVQYLKDRFPEYIAQEGDSMDKLMKYSGKRELILMLERYAYEAE